MRGGTEFAGRFLSLKDPVAFLSLQRIHMEGFHACLIKEQQIIVLNIRDIDKFRDIIHGSTKAFCHAGQVFLPFPVFFFGFLQFPLTLCLVGTIYV